MLTQEDAVEIEVLLKQGMGVREVARRCGVSRNTVRRVRAEGSGRCYHRAPRASKLDAFREYIGERLAAASSAWIPATVMLREIRERGYTGSHSILRVFMASLRPARVEEPANRFETAAGQQMQVDWAEFRVEGLYDNMATVVLKRDAGGKGWHRFHDGMLALSHDFGCRFPSLLEHGLIFARLD